MRALDRLISFIFSVIMLVISIVLILIGVGLVDSKMIIDMLNDYVFVKDMITANTFNALTIAGIVLLLASLKTTIFLSLFKTKDKSPILVKTPNGEIEIAQETITSTVRNVGLSFDNIKDVQAKMIKKKKGVAVYAMLSVYANSNIREITEAMQQDVKETLKATTGVNVLEVNIKVKNIYSKQRKNDEIATKIANSAKEELKEVEESKKPISLENIPMTLNEDDNNVVETAENINTQETQDLDQIAINDVEENK